MASNPANDFSVFTGEPDPAVWAPVLAEAYTRALTELGGRAARAEAALAAAARLVAVWGDDPFVLTHELRGQLNATLQGPYEH